MRFDLLFSVVIGGVFSSRIDLFFYLKNISFCSSRNIDSYFDLLLFIYNRCNSNNIFEFKVILFIPPVVLLYSIIQSVIINKRKVIPSNLIDDIEINNESKDKLKISSEAKSYAEKIWNNGSTNSLVFGLDAPWGTGKSSYVNIVIQYFMDNYSDDVIVYKFNPTKYQNKKNLIDVFARGLASEIKKKVYVPELFPIVSAYSRLLSNSINGISKFGISFNVNQNRNRLENLFSKLEDIMSIINKKVVVFIDDLDRLDFETIKEIILVIQKGFSLSNMSFVLCYDTSNINVFDNNKETEKISEFLEKYINIKTSIFIDSSELSGYFTDIYLNTMSEDLLANKNICAKIASGIEEIYNSSEFHKYRPFLSNVRKIKRLVNTIFMLNLNSIDFENWDINIHDFINLLLLYLNYPHIFRTIYDSETAGKTGFFAVLRPYNLNQSESKYKNSDEYIDYVKSLTESEAFLVEKIFNVKRISSVDTDHSSLACFNGSEFYNNNRNLEKYIRLILNNRKPLKTEESNFYKNLRDKIISDEKSISDILWRNEFSTKYGTRTHDKLYRVLYNTPTDKYSITNSGSIINSLIMNIHKYPLIDDGGYWGSRHAIILFLINFLDKMGWHDNSCQFYNNVDENVVQIAQRIFETKDDKDSILDSMLKKRESVVISLYDLLMFRLSCCSNRGGSNFNLSRALFYYSYPSSKRPTALSDITIEEVRSLSQYVYRFFKESIADKGHNIFDLIDKLDTDIFLGSFSDYLHEIYKDEEIENKIIETKNRMLSFTLHQLSNDIVDSGVGCGYYNLDGRESETDKAEIKKNMNIYLFENCFNKSTYENAYDSLLYYFIRFKKNTQFYSDSNKININSFRAEMKKEVDFGIFKKYWHENNQVLQGYITSIDDSKYDENLGELFEILSELARET
ncbi:MAG: P-loop NTPase fold protein [Sphaerochaetaceae bacterium]|nr:P-loop NTPase fold protein [Sphaerochaetaceae bacterium]